MKHTSSLGLFGLLLGFVFLPKQEAKPERPAPARTPAPMPTADAGDGFEEEQSSLAARIAAAETIREVGTLVAEAERVHARRPKLIKKCLRKAAERINQLSHPLPFE